MWENDIRWYLNFVKDNVIIIKREIFKKFILIYANYENIKIIWRKRKCCQK